MGKALHVLLIDDDEDDKYLFLEALNRLDKPTQCSYHSNGIDGLKWLTTTGTTPDYIFLDINMPRMNGLEVLKEIKSDRHINHIPVIIYSTSGNEQHRQQALQLGAALYLPKPYKLNDLKKAILSVFETIKPAGK
jgi:CheY-like chemotaxis protein